MREMREMRETRETRKMGVQHNNNLIKVVKRRPDFEIHHVVNLFPTIRNLWNGLAPLVKVHPRLFFLFLVYLFCRSLSTIRHIRNLLIRYSTFLSSFNFTNLLHLFCRSLFNSAPPLPFARIVSCELVLLLVPRCCISPSLPLYLPVLSLLFFYFCLLFILSLYSWLVSEDVYSTGIPPHPQHSCPLCPHRSHSEDHLYRLFYLR